MCEAVQDSTAARLLCSNVLPEHIVRVCSSSRSCCSSQAECSSVTHLLALSTHTQDAPGTQWTYGGFIARDGQALVESRVQQQQGLDHCHLCTLDSPIQNESSNLQLLYAHSSCCIVLQMQQERTG
jgi:hypothetical protein